jgi:hypothetical protein
VKVFSVQYEVFRKSGPMLATPDFLINPATRKELWTPSDTVTLPNWVRGICFATAGAVALELVGDSQSDVVPSGALAPGVIHACRPTLIKATGTTATGFVIWGGVPPG